MIKFSWTDSLLKKLINGKSFFLKIRINRMESNVAEPLRSTLTKETAYATLRKELTKEDSQEATPCMSNFNKNNKFIRFEIPGKTPPPNRMPTRN